MLCRTYAVPRFAPALTTVMFSVVLALSSTDARAAAQPPVGLGTAGAFALLAGSGATNTGPSTLNGNLGLTPGTAVIGFGPPATLNGSAYVADATAGRAQSDLKTAYDDAAGRIPAAPVSGDLGGLTLTGGVYRASSSLGLTGSLTLDAQGDPAAVFIIQVGSSLTTASASRVNVVNGAQPCNVFWQIGSSATLGAASTFAGSILALTSITMNDAVTVNGRALARNGAVTLINDTITPAACATPGGATPGGTSPGAGGGGVTVPGGTVNGGANGTGNGSAVLTTSPRTVARTITRFGLSHCIHGTFRAVVTGRSIRRVVFSQGGRVIATRGKAPFEALVGSGGGTHTVTARVTFTDATPAAKLALRFKSCAKDRAGVTRSRPKSRLPRTPVAFTG
jgi:hypothetical protein